MMSETNTATGPWQSGEPPREGRYLIIYRQGSVTRPFIGDWLDGRWSAVMGDTEVLQWAEILHPKAL